MKFDVKNDFEILKKVHYLDNASTSQKPDCVIEEIVSFYKKYNSNVHRSNYDLGYYATTKFENARSYIASHFRVLANEIIFTSGTTDGINLISSVLKDILINQKSSKNEIVLTEMEHNSNLLPWQKLKNEGFKLKFIPVKDDLTLDYDVAKELINEKTALVSFTHISNVTGVENDVVKLCKLAKKKGTLSLIDGAQSVLHRNIDLNKIGCDFFVCSAHKALGPFGIGMLYIKEEIQKLIPSLRVGGGMVDEVNYDSSTYRNIPYKFEAGTQNVSGVIGFARALKYIKRIGFDSIRKHEEKLYNYTIKELQKIEGINLFTSKEPTSIISFTINRIHPHDVASFLNDGKVCVRAGHHCSQLLHHKLKLDATVRISFWIYNNEEDINILIKQLKKAKRVFK
ncbi:cysteine desulfurase [Candidatus Woesearchaeota archaeon]|nr:cysteine desulfurase [Candidatus Woesearchaeota archaeon]